MIAGERIQIFVNVKLLLDSVCFDKKAPGLL